MQRGALALGVIGAAFAAAAPVHAQSSSNAEASVSIVQPFSVARMQNLEFGTLHGTGQIGAIVVSPTGGFSVLGGAQSDPDVPPHRAEFSISGIAGRAYSVTLPSSAAVPGVAVVSGQTPLPLTASLFNAVSVNSGSVVAAQLDGAGQDTVYVGARIDVPKNAAHGLYTLELVLTADYD